MPKPHCSVVLMRRIGRIRNGGLRRRIRGYKSADWHVFEAWACREADAVAVVSDADKWAVASLHGVDASKVTVIPNCIDTSRFAETRSTYHPVRHRVYRQNGLSAEYRRRLVVCRCHLAQNSRRQTGCDVGHRRPENRTPDSIDCAGSTA